MSHNMDIDALETPGQKMTREMHSTYGPVVS